MADSLYDLLAPELHRVPGQVPPAAADGLTTSYLTRLTTLPLTALSTSTSTNEAATLQDTSAALGRALQALSRRSHGAIVGAHAHLATLGAGPSLLLPAVARAAGDLRETLPRLDDAAVHFSETYTIHNAANHARLERRRRALLLARNTDRLADVLELPTLLASAVAAGGGASGAGGGAGGIGGGSGASYGSALDLNAHIRRLHALYPQSPLIGSIVRQADESMRTMTTNLITSLRHPSLKLAAAIRTISWLRRIAPELDATGPAGSSTTTLTANREGSLGALFLVCRLANLQHMLDALEPLRELADQETRRGGHDDDGVRAGSGKNRTGDTGGHQTEKYLKRYIEIFREQSFAIISMYRSIFPDLQLQPQPEAATTSGPTTTRASTSRKGGADHDPPDPLFPRPPALCGFALQLVGLLEGTLRAYLPNVRERAGRDSLLTQVLYCAGSLGRLGADFGMVLACLGRGGCERAGEGEEEDGDEDGDEDKDDEAWVDVVKKHRLLASRLELMVGAGKDG